MQLDLKVIYSQDHKNKQLVFRDKTNSDICHSKKHLNRHKPANESNSHPDDGSTKIYIESTQNKTKSSSLDGAFQQRDSLLN